MPNRTIQWTAAPLPLVLLTLAFSTGAAHAGPPIDLQGVQVVDLTYAFDETTIYWPTAPTTFKLDRLSFGKTDAGFFYAANAFCTPEHGGTHLDAPIHFAEGMRTADQIPVGQLIAPAVVIDVGAKAAADADYRLALEDVKAWEAKHGPIVPALVPGQR